MNTFWNNISKFPRFFLSVFIGFFLTTFYPIFKLLKNKKKKFFFSIILILFILFLYNSLNLMIGLK